VDELDECGICKINLLRLVGSLDTAINMIMACLLKYLKFFFDILLFPFVCSYNYNMIAIFFSARILYFL
jgi:hypothetical protein